MPVGYYDYSIDCYKTNLTINGELVRVSFHCVLQKITFTNIDTCEAGVFDVRNGFIVSKKPHDHILEDEITSYLERL